MMRKVRVYILVFGRVQKVFFRISAKMKAREFGVFGWIRNLPTGQVEAVLEGEKEMVEKMIAWAKRGPFLARVDSVKVKWEGYRGEFQDFVIRYD